MINNSNLEEVKNLIKKEQSLKVVLAQEDNFNRKILEYGNFSILLSIEKGDRTNKIRQTDSGLNHVLATLAKKKNIAIGINLEEIKMMESKEKAERLSRIMQNLKICLKTKTRIAIKIKSLQEARAFLIGIGASTNQLKETIVF